MNVKTYKDLEVWQLGVELVEQLYSITRGFPREEIFGLSSQIRRAAISIPSNIAEGASRNSKKEFIQFLHISLGSLAELETQIYIAKHLKFITDSSEVEELLEKLRRKLLNFIKYQKTSR